MIYRMKIVAEHRFGETVGLSYHRTRHGAEQAGARRLKTLMAAEDPEWHNGFNLSVEQIILED